MKGFLAYEDDFDADPQPETADALSRYSEILAKSGSDSEEARKWYATNSDLPGFTELATVCTDLESRSPRGIHASRNVQQRIAGGLQSFGSVSLCICATAMCFLTGFGVRNLSSIDSQLSGISSSGKNLASSNARFTAMNSEYLANISKVSVDRQTEKIAALDRHFELQERVKLLEQERVKLLEQERVKLLEVVTKLSKNLERSSSSDEKLASAISKLTEGGLQQSAVAVDKKSHLPYWTHSHSANMGFVRSPENMVIFPPDARKIMYAPSWEASQLDENWVAKLFIWFSKILPSDGFVTKSPVKDTSPVTSSDPQAKDPADAEQ